MLEVLRYIALNALNTVQKIKAMLKMSKIHYTDFNALKAMYAKGVTDVKYYEYFIKGSKYIQTCFC